MEALHEMFDDFTSKDAQQVENLTLNFKVPLDRIADMFSAGKFNWEKENSDQYNPQYASYDMVFKVVYEQLVAEGQEKAKKMAVQSNSGLNNGRLRVLPDNQSLTQMIQSAKKSQSKQDQQRNSNAGTKKEIEHELEQLYISRKSRGNQRAVFNEHIQKIPGLYNEKGNIKITTSETDRFDIFNLTAAGRVHNMDLHFDILQTIMKEQLKAEQFDEFGQPASDCQRLIGRIINVNPEENQKLTENNIGLLNLNEENSGGIYKIKLQLGELQSFSFYDGEIVVVEGINDASNGKINVMRVHKPMIQQPKSNFNLEQIKQITQENYKERAVQVMVACGPFTFKNSLSYQGLQDFLQLAKKEQPQAILLMGPFLDINQQDIFSGEIFYDTPDKGKVFISHEELFQDLINIISKELQGVKTKVIFVPSHKDIHHFDPLPQQPFTSSYFNNFSVPFVLAPNPSTIQLNDIKIGLINADILKDMCLSMCPKNMEPPKIDLSLRGILEQRMFYPLYPPQVETPIEYDQIDKFFLTQGSPDILITPSDLIQFTKNIDGCVSINPGNIIKNDAAGTYCSLTIEPFDYKSYKGPFESVDLKVKDRVRVDIINI